mmetsp:Transcript_22664/g.65258  ORF Transcript_22664/g.65258 Transcript_22664/m.65258 type:complete len:132 (+) Transcript_22664:1157-1552(+)
MCLHDLRIWDACPFFQPIDVLRVHPPQHPALTQQSQEAMGRGGLRTTPAILAGVQVTSEPKKGPRVVKELLELKQIFGARETEGGGIERLVKAGSLGSEIGYAAGDGDAGTGHHDDIPQRAQDVDDGGEAL